MLDISGTGSVERVRIARTERGGPPVAPPSGEDGSGSKLLNDSVTGHLGGTIDFDWSGEGVIVTLTFEPKRWRPSTDMKITGAIGSSTFPKRSGFGTRMLERAFTASSAGRAKIDRPILFG